MVPEGYFEHLSQRLGEKRKHTAGANKEEETGTCKKVLIASGRPVNVAALPRNALEDGRAVGKEEKGARTPGEDQVCLLIIHLRWRLVINSSTAFITLQTNLRTLAYRSYVRELRQTLEGFALIYSL